MHKTLTAFFAATFAVAASAQLSVAIPAGTANAPGNSSNAFPWGTSASGWGGLRLMATYGAVNFTSQNVTGPILINRLKWRPNDTTAAVLGGTFTTATVELSTSPVGWASVTTNFPTNHGPDRMVAYSGPVVHTPTPGSAAWTPQSWCVDIALTTPFLYDPANGDLVIDVDYPTGSFTGGGVGQMDVQSTNASRVFASSMYPVANGISTNHGPVVEVGYVPPSGYAYSLPYGTGCYDRASASFYELFANGTFDLSNTGMQLVPTGTGYAVIPASPAWFTPTSTALPLGDDVVSAAQALGFTLSYPGGSTTSVYIGSNGFVFGQSNTNAGCCSGAPAALLTQGPRWSPLWCNLDPSLGGAVHFDTDPANGAAYVTFLNVPEDTTPPTNTNSFQIAFFATGVVEYRWQACTVTTTQVLTGWSPGASNKNPGSVDLSATTVIVTENDLDPLLHAASARPVTGTTIQLDTSRVPTGSALGATLGGVSQFLPGQSLSAVGMPGCFRFQSGESALIWVPSNGAGSSSFTIPNDPNLAGVRLYTQSAALAPGLNGLGAITSNGLELVIDIN